MKQIKYEGFTIAYNFKYLANAILHGGQQRLIEVLATLFRCSLPDTVCSSADTDFSVKNTK